MKKRFANPGKVLLAAGIFVICASAAMAGGNTEKAATGPVTLSWQGWDPISKYQPILDEWNKDHPNTRVDYTSVSDQNTKIMTEAVSGTLPDIIGVGTGSIVQFAGSGILMEIPKSVQQDPSVNWSDFWPSALKFAEYNGKYYAIPSDGGTYGLVYNKKMFDATGVPYPTDKWTWDDFLAAAKKLTVIQNGKVTRYATSIFVDWGAIAIFPYIWQNGGSMLNADHTKSILDQPPAYEAIQWVKDLDTKYHVASPIENTSSIPLPIASEINSGTIAMGRVGLWETKVLHDSDILDWAVAPMPAGKAGHSEILFVNCLAVSAKTKYPEQAMSFLKFATSNATQKTLLEHTGDPQIAVRKSLRDVAIERFEAKRNASVYIDAMNYSRYFPLIPHLNELTGVVDREMTKTLIEGQPAKTVFTNIAQQQDKILSGQ